MREIDQKIQKLEAKIMLDPKMYSLDPIRNHRIKVRLFNIARGELLEQDLKEKVTGIQTRLSAAEATWEMAENLYRQLADQVREHSYDIKDLNR